MVCLGFEPRTTGWPATFYFKMVRDIKPKQNMKRHEEGKCQFFLLKLSVIFCRLSGATFDGKMVNSIRITKGSFTQRAFEACGCSRQL